MIVYICSVADLPFSPGADIRANTAPLKPTDRGMRWFELALVLLVAVAASTLGSINIARADLPASHNPMSMRWVFGIIHEITSLLLLFYVLKRRHLGFRDLGLQWSWRDLINGMWLACASLLSFWIGWFVVHRLFILAIGTPGRVHTAVQVLGKPTLAAVPYFLLSPLFEELIVRVYLMTEVTELTGSATLAALASAAIQTSYHLYYGWSTALSMFFMFLAFSIFFAVWKKALPVIVAHELFDIFALIRAW